MDDLPVYIEGELRDMYIYVKRQTYEWDRKVSKYIDVSNFAHF